MNSRNYRQIIQAVSETPWAILPSTLMVIREIIARHQAGELLTREEIEERVGTGRSRPGEQNSGSVAVIPLWGVLVPHAGMMVDVSQEGTGLDSWLQTFRAAVTDPQVGSILLHVDSPGGSAALVTEAASEIRAARGQKPINAVASTMAASAAYALASQAEKLYVTPSGMVGSVGVYLVHEDLSGALEQQGVKPTVISAPEDGFKMEDNPFGPLTEEARAHLQGMVDHYYAQFVNDVAKGRGVSYNQVDTTYGRGRVLNAKAALAAGMVDGVATFEQVLHSMLRSAPGATRPRAQEAERHIAATLDGLKVPAAVVAALKSGNVALTEWTFVGYPKTEADTLDLEPPTALDAILTTATEEGLEEAPSTTPPTDEGGKHMEPVSTEGRPATLEELAAHRDHIKATMDDLDAQYAGRLMDPEAQQEFDDLQATHEHIVATIKNVQDRAARLAKLATDDDRRVQGTQTPATIYTNADSRGPDNVYDLAAYRQHANSLEDIVGLWRDGARKVNEHLAYESETPDHARAFVDKLLQKDTSADPKDSFAHRILVTANPAYDAAFGKLIMNKPLSQPEEHLVRMAVTNTGLGAETPVPVTIDPTVLLTTDGSTNPLRSISRVVTITGNKWQGINSEGVVVNYEAEMSTVADQTPDFTAPTAEVVKAHGWVEFSIEVDQDWGSFRGELQRMFADAKDVKEAEKFLFGTGSNEPEGVLWALNDDGSSIIESGSAGTLALEDLETIADAMPPRFDANARWVANKKVYSSVRGLAGAEGRIDVWVPIAQGFPQSPGGSGAQAYTLFGYPTSVASDMSNEVDTGHRDVAVLGDFGRGFLIVDRIGMNVELMPLVPQTGGRPRGSRGLYVYFRNTSKLITANAFRVLQIKSS